MKYIKQLLKSIFSEVLEEKIPRINYIYQREINHSLFSYIGISRIRELLDDAEKGGDKYINLAELYSHTLRNNLSSQNEDINRRIFELTPKLGQFQDAFNKRIQ